MEFKDKKYKVTDYIKILFEICPFIVILTVLLRVFIAFIPSLQVLATSSFIDTAIDIFKSGNKSRIYFPLFSLMGLVGTSWLSSALLNFANLKLTLKTSEKINLSMVKKQSKLAYEHIENNDTWDLISRVGEDCSEKVINGFNNLFNIAQYVIEILSILIIITAQVWWVAFIVLIVSFPLFKLSFKCGKIDYEAYSESEKYFRKANYLKDVLSSRENVEERTLFGYTESINEMWFDKYETARKIEYKAEKQNFIKTKIASGITALLSIIIALILLKVVKEGNISTGMYISLVTASFNLVQKMSWELSDVMQKYAKNKIYLKDLTEFSKLKEVQGADKLKDTSIRKFPFKSLEFKNVSFSYPGTNRKILSKLNMYLENNKQYAFVGKNGAGKTTITKLLTGLYDNYEGKILINGKDLRSFSEEQLKAYFSVVYQDFAKYNISLKDNISLGNCIGDLDKEGDSIKNILQKLELNEIISKLPKGLNTNLGKINKNGVDLSGGQWQRIALARALISNSPLNILDEPTASLDPVSENKIYSMFKKISEKKSTILITHRLGAARIADEILVIDDGCIAESGSHEELICKNGIYAKMFESQRGWYDEEKS